MMGVGVNIFPGLAGKIQGSEFGQSVTEGLAGIFGGGTQQAPTTSPMPQRRPEPQPQPIPTAATVPDFSIGMTGMEDEARRRSIPTLSDINMVRPEGFEVLPQYSMVRPEGMEVPYDMVRPEGLEVPLNRVRRDYGTGIPPMLPPIVMPGSNYNEEDRYRGMQSALEMAADLASAGDIEGMYEGNRVYNRLYRPGLRGFAMGGEIEGPGTGTSDSIPAEIYQDGKPVQKAALSDGEFVMTAKAVKGAGNGSRDRGVSRMYELMRRFESGEMA
jgi:hypothetical protein